VSVLPTEGTNHRETFRAHPNKQKMWNWPINRWL